MTREMPSIDTSGIEDLQKIKAEQDVYRERIQKMQDMREKVSDQIYEKVFSDYSEKLDVLNVEAEPLKDRIRGQYAILEGIMKELTEQLAAVRLEKEELEFRHTLGEFEGNQYSEHLREAEMSETAKQAELDDAEEMKQQFLAVFDSEEDLLARSEEMSTIPVEKQRREEAAAVVEPEPEEAPESDIDPVMTEESIEEIDDEDLVEDLGDSLDGLEAETGFDVDDDFETDLDDDLGDDLDDDLDTGFETSETEDVEPPPPPLPELDSERATGKLNVIAADDETLRTDSHGLGQFENDDEEDDAATLLMAAPPTEPAESGEADGTMIIANPKIISLNHATKGQVIVLGMGTTSLGRSPENDIHITEDRISRKHSQITFGPGGYAIYDLNSENGTYVNGNRIREHFLSDGDIITVGTYKYQYRDR